MGRLSLALNLLVAQFRLEFKPKPHLRRYYLGVLHCLVILSMLFMGVSPAFAQKAYPTENLRTQDSKAEDSIPEVTSPEKHSEEIKASNNSRITSWAIPQTAQPVANSNSEMALRQPDRMSSEEQAEMAASILPLHGDLMADDATALEIAVMGVVRPGELLYMAYRITGVSDFKGLTLEVSAPAGFSWKGEVGEFDAQASVLNIPLEPLAGSLLEEEGLIVWQVDENASGPFEFKARLLAEGKELASSSLVVDEDGLFMLKAEGGLVQGLEDRVKVSFPPELTADGLEVRLRVPLASHMPAETLSGMPFEITAENSTTKEKLTNFNPPLILTVSYDEKLYDKNASRLSLYYLDENEKRWRLIPSQVDTENHLVQASIDHFTVFDIGLSDWEVARLPAMQDWQVSQFTGAAAYSYPLWTPPGPGGLSPRLELTYNSQSIDNIVPYETQASWVGMGWELSTGYIALNMDSRYEPDTTYTISAAGVEGMLLQGEDGYYHTLDESFWRIAYDEQNDTWTAWDKQGTKYIFGDTRQTRAMYDKEACDFYPLPTDTYQWELSQIVNIYGMGLSFNYFTDGELVSCSNGNMSWVDRHIYPESIVYPGGKYSVYFEREARVDLKQEWTQPDALNFFQRYRLKTVHIRNNGLDVRRYNFTYASNPVLLPYHPYSSGGYTLTLLGVQEQNGSGTASLPATIFTYDEMHLVQAENGYGGKVVFDYDIMPWYEDMADSLKISGPSTGCIMLFPHSYLSEMWPINGGEAYCDYGGNLQVRGQAYWMLEHGADGRDHKMFQPGSVYFLSVQVQNKQSQLLNTVLSLQDGVRVTQVASATGIARYQTVTLSGYITLPLDAQIAQLHLECSSRCQVSNLEKSLHLSRYRVLQKTLYDSPTDLNPDVFQYRYDEGASNDPEHSPIWKRGGWYIPEYREFRGHALVQELGPDGRISSSYFYQDDERKSRISSSLVSSETYSEVFEAADLPPGWDGFQGGNPDVARLEGDQALRLVSASAETGAMRTENTLTNGMLAVTQFRLDGETPAAYFYLESSSGQRWGVYAKTDGSLTAQYDQGSGWEEGATIFTPAQFLRQKWYVLLLGVDEDDQFLIQVWQRDDPSMNGLYRHSMTGGQAWRFKMTAQNGTAWLDTYSEGQLYTLQQTFYNKVYIPTLTQTYAELEIFWVYPTEIRSYIFEADAGFVAKRSTYYYQAPDATSYGNLWRELEAEWDAAQGKWRDYRFNQTRYFPNTGATYLVGLPGIDTQWKCPDNSFDGACSTNYPFPNVPPLGQLLSQTPYIYDSNASYSTPPTQGKLSWKRVLLSHPNPNYSDPRYLDQHYVYDAWGNRTSVITYNSEGTSAAFASANPQTATTNFETVYHTYVESEVNAVSHTTSYTYDYDLGLPLTMTGPNGPDTTVTVSYDSFGRLLKVIRPGDTVNSPTMQFTYNDSSIPFSIQLSQKIQDGQFANFERFYNGLGLLIQTQTEDAVLMEGTKDIVTDTWYNGYGKVIKQSVPYSIPQQGGFYEPVINTYFTDTTYDIMGRTDLVTAPDGNQTKNHYFDLENQVEDPLHHFTRSLNDIWGRVVEVHPALDPWIKYYYDPLDRLTKVEKRSGGGSGTLQTTTQLAYDYAGRKLSMIDPDMGSWSYTYKPVGTLLTQTDARGCITTLGFDDIQRLKDKSYSGTCSGNPVTYVYDFGQYNTGYRTSMTDTQNSASWSYDVRGQLIAETRSVYGVSGSFRTEWNYNSAGLLNWMKYPASNNGQVGEQVNYAYHPQMSLNTVLSDFPYAYVNSTSYDAAGRVKQRTLGGTTNQVQVLYSYFPWNTEGGRLEWLKSGMPSTDPTKFQYYTYDYDPVGNVESIKDYKAGNPYQIQSFLYDNIYRLTNAGATGGNQGAGDYGPETYSYESTTGRLASKNGISYTYSPGHFNAVSSLSNGNTYGYDANGNMTSRHVYEGGAWKNYTLTYDAENRLTSVTGPVTANFKYDGDGKRVRATVNGGTDTVFIGNYFEWNVATQAKKTYYYAEATRIAVRISGGEPQWILGDHLGSTSKIVSYSGTETGGEWYKAWGEIRRQTGTIPTNYQYTGQYNQIIIGLYYYGARWYDPALSRWTQPDSQIPDPSKSKDFDRYSYSLNNPLRYSDPGGHRVWDVVAQFLYGFAAEFALNMPWATSPGADILQVNESETTASLAGRVAGDVAAIVVGMDMTISGATGASAGVASCGTGVLCGVGVAVVAIGATAAGIGIVTAGKAVGNIGSNLARLSGNSDSGSSSSDLQEWESKKPFEGIVKNPDGTTTEYTVRKSPGEDGGWSRMVITRDSNGNVISVWHEAWKGSSDPRIDPPYHTEEKPIGGLFEYSDNNNVQIS
jgi:RHS repeat-associated protein